MPPTDDIMGHSDHFLPHLYPFCSTFIGQNHLGSPVEFPCDLAGYDLFSKTRDSQSHYHQNNSFYATTYPPASKQSSRPSSHTNNVCQCHSPSQDVKERFGESSSSLSSPDSSATPPYLSYYDEPWINSPASVTTDVDDDSSLSSSISSLSPNVFDLDSEIPVEDEDDENFYLVSPKSQSIYQPLEPFSPHTSPHFRHDEHFIPVPHLDDNNLSPLTFFPPDLAPLRLLSFSESEHQPTSALNVEKSSAYIPPYNYHSFSDYDHSAPLPCSPSRRRSATLPELEPATLNADPFGLHKSLSAEVPLSLAPPPLHDIDADLPGIHWRSLPGCETDDDLIPVELASKNYIPDPSAIVPTTSTGIRSLLLWDHDHDHDHDRSDIPIPRSPSPENFYLDPAVLMECADEEMKKVYELRQRTAKNEKWERERCRELSALLRLKLDERGVPEGGDGSYQSGSHSPPYSSNLPLSTSSSSDSLTVYQPQPRVPSSLHSLSSSSFSSSTLNSTLIPSLGASPTLPSTCGKPQAQSEPKYKIRSMAQLVASMLFHRQTDAVQHLSKKHRLEPSSSHSSHYCPHLSSLGGRGMKVPRSRLSKVILPEELQMDSGEEGQGAGQQDGHDDEDVIMDVDDRPLSHSCMEMDLEKRGRRNSSSHTVTGAAPPSPHMSTQW